MRRARSASQRRLGAERRPAQASPHRAGLRQLSQRATLALMQLVASRWIQRAQPAGLAALHEMREQQVAASNTTCTSFVACTCGPM